LDEAHPGVTEIMAGGDYLLGGEVATVEGGRQVFSDYNFTPAQTKEIFRQRGWRRLSLSRPGMCLIVAMNFYKKKPLSRRTEFLSSR